MDDSLENVAFCSPTTLIFIANAPLPVRKSEVLVWGKKFPSTYKKNVGKKMKLNLHYEVASKDAFGAYTKASLRFPDVRLQKRGQTGQHIRMKQDCQKSS